MTNLKNFLKDSLELKIPFETIFKNICDSYIKEYLNKFPKGIFLKECDDEEIFEIENNFFIFDYSLRIENFNFETALRIDEELAEIEILGLEYVFQIEIYNGIYDYPFETEIKIIVKKEIDIDFEETIKLNFLESVSKIFIENTPFLQERLKAEMFDLLYL